MRFKAVTVGVVLAGTALGSSALTLGRARGAAWIGQTLELQIPVQQDAGQTETGLCAEADVFHGEARVDAARVRIQTEPSGQPDGYNIRVLSSTPIDEPVVTVYLRAGCNVKASRKYVLLADFPPEPQSAPARATPVAPVTPTVDTPPSPIDNASAAPVATNAAPAPLEVKPRPPQPKPAEPKPKAKAQAPAAAKEAAATSPKKADKPVELAAATPPKATGKPRLRLDPVENLAERVKTLESSTVQSTLLQDQTQEAQRMQQLQSDLRTLLDQAAKNEASLAAMRERLEKAEAERVPVALVYGLVALVALCVGALAYLWTRRGPTVRWEDDTPVQTTTASTSSKPAQ